MTQGRDTWTTIVCKLRIAAVRQRSDRSAVCPEKRQHHTYSPKLEGAMQRIPVSNSCGNFSSPTSSFPKLRSMGPGEYALEATRNAAWTGDPCTLAPWSLQHFLCVKEGAPIPVIGQSCWLSNTYLKNSQEILLILKANMGCFLSHRPKAIIIEYTRSRETKLHSVTGTGPALQVEAAPRRLRIPRPKIKLLEQFSGRRQPWTPRFLFGLH